MALISKYENQTVFDLLLIHSGAISGLFEFLEANSLTEIEIPEGTYLAPEVLKPEVVAYFKSKNNEVSILTGSGSLPHGAPSIVTLNGEPFNVYYGGTENDIQLLDQDNNPIIPISVVGDVVKVNVPTSASAWWTRNPDWVPLPEVTAGSGVFAGVCAVYEDNELNYFSLNGVSSIDWGDGTISGTIHQFIYSTISSTVCVDDEGNNYKTVLVTAICGPYTSTKEAPTGQQVANWLDILFDSPNQVVVAISTYNESILPRCERVRAVSPMPNCTYGNSRLSEMTALRVLEFDFSGVQSAGAIFQGTGDVRMSDGSPINFNFSSMPASNFDFGYSGISLVGDINCSSATSLNALFYYATQLRGRVNITTSPALSNISNLLGASKVTELIISDCSGVTATTNFAPYKVLRKCVLTGITVGFSVIANNMSAAAINEMFTSLGIASGPQTINVAYNPGSATCNPSIATSKGFTVIV